MHALQPFTNYSVQLQAFTRAGDGVSSLPIVCRTEEAVPDAVSFFFILINNENFTLLNTYEQLQPERIKSASTGESSVIISWLPPRRRNGILIQYTLFVRVLNKGQEVTIRKQPMPAETHHFEATQLTTKETYEAWLTASTKVGSGASTPVLKLQPNSQVPAAIVSFGQIVTVSWRVDVRLACQYVGFPRPIPEWSVADPGAKQQRLEVGDNNTLTLRNVQRSHASNYTCLVRNAHGHDRITYQLSVQVPPAAPKLTATPSAPAAVHLNWHLSDTGGAPIKNYVNFI